MYGFACQNHVCFHLAYMEIDPCSVADPTDPYHFAGSGSFLPGSGSKFGLDPVP